MILTKSLLSYPQEGPLPTGSKSTSGGSLFFPHHLSHASMRGLILLCIESQTEGPIFVLQTHLHFPQHTAIS